MIYFGVDTDLFSDGLMIGTGVTITTTFGVILALGQLPADVPEGFAVIVNLRTRGVHRAKRLLIAAALALPVLVGAVFGYLVGPRRRGARQGIAPRLHRRRGHHRRNRRDRGRSAPGRRARFAAMATVRGFAVFAAIPRYLG